MYTFEIILHIQKHLSRTTFSNSWNCDFFLLSCPLADPNLSLIITWDNSKSRGILFMCFVDINMKLICWMKAWS